MRRIPLLGRLCRLVCRPLDALGRRGRLGFGAGIVLSAILGLGAPIVDRTTAADAFCASCHVHPQATATWKLGEHYGPRSGVVVHCVECHLPPGGLAYWREKLWTGTRDIYGKVFTDVASIDWQERSTLEHARDYTFESACRRCHENLFPLELSRKGEEAHLHYTAHAGEIRCINCHLHTGHRQESPAAGGMSLAAPSGVPDRGEVFRSPTQVSRLADFTEKIPGTRVSFDMVAIPAAEFLMGSPADEPFRRADEGPRHRVRLGAYFIGRCEVSWDEYEAFYAQTAAEGRSDTRTGTASGDDAAAGVDAISGATPPYGNPDQGWGRGRRPAITMTHHAATVYCEWLSRATGKRYRLPTEAEWEYACRGGRETPYFFDGSPDDFAGTGFWSWLFGADLDAVKQYAIFDAGRTETPASVRPNPFGLLHMAGNVREFCIDYYSPDGYGEAAGHDILVDPVGPDRGSEHVIRGGSYESDATELRSAARDHTRLDAWMVTDPQIPKSRWWYSDCRDVGFRVVCEWPID